MGKSIKLKNDFYIDSSSIIHERRTLKEILVNILNKISNYGIINDNVATKTGRIINGKDEYVKRISVTSLGSVGTHSKDLGFTLNDVLITEINGIALSFSNNYFPLPMGDFSSQNTWGVRVQLNNSTNQIDVITNNGNFESAYFNICYINKN